MKDTECGKAKSRQYITYRSEEADRKPGAESSRAYRHGRGSTVGAGSIDPALNSIGICRWLRTLGDVICCRYQQTRCLGELTTLGLSTTRNSTSPVIVITKKQDAAFCFVNNTVQGDCGLGPSSPPALMNQYLPLASSFSYKIVEGMGHNLNLKSKGLLNLILILSGCI
jgi:hypothetical protein